MQAFEVIDKIEELIKYLDEKSYPEIYFLLNHVLDEGLDEVDVLSFLSTLVECDPDKDLPLFLHDFIVSSFEELINIGDMDAACDLGAYYYNGRSGLVDYDKALYYYSLAASQGHNIAQENLGFIYYYGRNVKVDYAKAFHYFSLGAFLGMPISLYKIGDMYRFGYHVEQNDEEAFKIYKRCLDLLSEDEMKEYGAHIMVRLGDCFYQGIGVGKDYNEALKYYQFGEQLFCDKILKGDKSCIKQYKKVIELQNEVRNKINKLMGINLR